MTFSTTIPCGCGPGRSADPERPVRAGAVTDVVQEHQFLALGGTGDGGAVDDFELQIRCGVQHFGDLRRVGLDARTGSGSPGQ